MADNINQTTLNVRIQQKYDTLENFSEKNEIYLANELLFAKVDDSNINIYLADGVTPFTQLQPIFSTTWVFGRNEISLTPVVIKATEWTQEKKAIKPVSGVLRIETEQVILPAWAADSKTIAMSCGVDFLVSNDAELSSSSSLNLPKIPI